MNIGQSKYNKFNGFSQAYQKGQKLNFRKVLQLILFTQQKLNAK